MEMKRKRGEGREGNDNFQAFAYYIEVAYRRDTRHKWIFDAEMKML